MTYDLLEAFCCSYAGWPSANDKDVDVAKMQSAKTVVVMCLWRRPTCLDPSGKTTRWRDVKDVTKLASLSNAVVG